MFWHGKASDRHAFLNKHGVLHWCSLGHVSVVSHKVGTGSLAQLGLLRCDGTRAHQFLQVSDGGFLGSFAKEHVLWSMSEVFYILLMLFEQR